MAGADDGEGVAVEDSFGLASEGENEPVAIAMRLIQELDDFAHLKAGDAQVLFLMRNFDKEKGGKMILGTMNLPRFSGEIGSMAKWMLARMCRGMPDFVMILDAAWWEQADVHRREALVYHELLHAGIKLGKDGEQLFTDEGRPVWDIRAHDLEEFDAVVVRYGAWKGDIVSFAAALRRGGVA